MSRRPASVSGDVAHATFTIDRVFTAPVARTFAAWSDRNKKRRWMSCHDDWRVAEHRLDFRVDGTEVNETVEPDGTVHLMKARFIDIVPDRRIVYAYEMQLAGARMSVSLVTVTFAPARGGTAMTFTEQVTFLDGAGDVDERRRGTELGLARLPDVLAAAQ